MFRLSSKSGKTSVSTFTAIDEIRAKGVGVRLSGCPKCEAAKAMDDFQRMQIESLHQSALVLGADLECAKKHRAWCLLVASVAVFVAALLLASDFGVFRP